MIDWVDVSLREWGDFYRDNYNELGYPRCSVESRLQSGGGAARVAGITYTPQSVVVIERAVLSMDADLREVVRVAYMTNASRYDQSKRLSRKLGKRITRSGLYDLISLAHYNIAGFLKGAEYKIEKSA